MGQSRDNDNRHKGTRSENTTGEINDWGTGHRETQVGTIIGNNTVRTRDSCRGQDNGTGDKRLTGQVMTLGKPIRTKRADTKTLDSKVNT